MEIYCKNTLLLEKAVDYSKTLGIDHHNAVIEIKRLPPSFSQMGIIEHPRILGKRTYINIYVKLNQERYITLAHEMVHARQVLNGEPLDENEAYLLETTLDNDHQKRL
tara:strand:- start:368 stop:691 length:324 start_codon:yes stop_codon:yes gene_type:complete